MGLVYGQERRANIILSEKVVEYLDLRNERQMVGKH